VINPSAHSAHHAAVASLTAAPTSGGGAARPAVDRGAVDADEPVVADLLAAEQGADDVDALAQAGVADLLARPAVAGDVLVAGLAVPSATQNRSGYISVRVAIACAMIAGW
jgi:hypothetical protein